MSSLLGLEVGTGVENFTLEKGVWFHFLAGIGFHMVAEPHAFQTRIGPWQSAYGHSGKHIFSRWHTHTQQ